MNEVAIERGIAFVGAIVVGVTAFSQLRLDWAAKGIDADLTKILLGLMAIGCVIALLAAAHVIGVHPA
jgi:hypothetical protein